MPRKSGSSGSRILRGIVLWSGVSISTAVVGITAIEFPYDVDAPVSAQELEKSRKYYAEAYRQSNPAEEQSLSAYETKYLRVATIAAEGAHVKERVAALVDRYGLRRRPVLEIGSGRGYLQDIAEDYTGLDISTNVRRFYHKKFVLGSATALPFPDNSFDGGWSIWVFEHVPNPEQAFSEFRRVMRDGGVIILLPAWNSATWLANGYDVRPYSDFNFAGKLMKATVSIRTSAPYRVARRVPVRFVRAVASLFGGPTALHYTRLTPNYEVYWEPDSDAVNSLDRYEAVLWFRTRGDECLNCEGVAGSIFAHAEPWLIIRVHKQS